MATVYRIHPAIGVARLGNSPSEFFIGPERVGQRPEPPGGFKDGQCRVKRQAARFRIYAHHDDGTNTEITDAEAEITWTVHLVNKKAANPGRGNAGPAADLTIDPGTRTLNGPDQRQVFDSGTIKFQTGPVTTVPLGEIRSDDDNHLLVLGGFGHSASPPGTPLDGYFWASKDWFDDVSDGPVTAAITLRADSSTPAVIPAWVVVAPPKFAPDQDSVITLYDRLLQAMIDGGLTVAPTKSTYTKDIYPILSRAREARWVVDVFGSHTWADPVTGNALKTTILNKLKAPGGGGGDMPEINDLGTGDDRLTATQFAHMQRWKTGNGSNYMNDWAGPPAPQADVTPHGLTRSALEACVGAAFYPGIEAGGLDGGSRPLLVAANYSEAFRLDHGAVSPGDVTYVMALPWQNDFYQCGDNWWPVPRPNTVERDGTLDQDWINGVVNSAEDMVDKWSQLGFIVKQGNQIVESERCSTPSITLLTPVLDFKDVPQGPMGMVREMPLAITFEVISPSASVTLEYAAAGAPNHPRLVAYNASASVGPTAPNASALARLWIVYRTGNAGEVLPPQVVKVKEQGGSQQWTITIIGNTVARKTAATAMALDRSGSMSEDRGDGQSKHDSLQLAASIFVDVMLDGDGVGIVAFNESAQTLQPVVKLGDGGLTDVNRGQTKDIINGNGLDPGGATSIGNGIYDARAILNASVDPYDIKALVVLTDGVENRWRYISDVAAQINEQTYAVGLGTAQNTSAPALQAVSGNNGGFLLITGAIGTDNRFLLQKYFLSILAGISNAEVVLDPDGQLLPGRVERVPFQLIRGDAGVEVILLTPYPAAVDFRLQSPSGQLIEPWMGSSGTGVRYIQSEGVSYYRLVLPREFQPDRFDQEGTWYALLAIGTPRREPTRESRDGSDRRILQLRSAPVTLQVPPPRVGISARRADAARATMAADPGSLAAVGAYLEGGGRSLPYTIVVHTYSDVSLQAHLRQASYEPGAVVSLDATLSESGIPTSPGAYVWAELTRPDGTDASVDFAEADAGRFALDYATTAPGVYRFRVRARGTTRRGEAFTRERTLTAGVWSGGDRNAGGDPGRELIDYWRRRDERLCALLDCLMQADGQDGRVLEEKARALGLDLATVRKCLGILCADDGGREGGRDE